MSTKLVRWEPFRNMVSLNQAMNHLFDEALVQGWPDVNGGVAAHLPIDAYSTDNEIVVRAVVPGVKAQDVEITVEGETLTIRGEIPARTENVNYLFAEQFHGSFSRTLQLNIPIDVEHIEATFENGILTVVLPKAEDIRPKTIKVRAK